MSTSLKRLGPRGLAMAVLCGVALCTSCSGNANDSGDTFGNDGGSERDGGSKPRDGGREGRGPDNNGSGGGYIAPVTDSGLEPDTSCAESKLEAKEAPLDMFFMLDVSGSMDGEKIDALKIGLNNFFQAPESAGLGAAAQKFPSVTTITYCDSVDYETPAIPWGQLPMPALTEWVNGLDSNGGTPTVAALTGAIKVCRDRVAAQPTHKCTVVLVTDGDPSRCGLDRTQIGPALGELAAKAFADGIPTFAIGFPGLSSNGEQMMATIATNGGTGTPVIIANNNVGPDFIKALQDIRGKALGCDYQMPTATEGTVDINRVKVTYKPSGATEPTEVKRVTDVADCSDNAWHYDNNANPTKLIMCPALCDRMKNDKGGEVQILLGCSQNIL